MTTRIARITSLDGRQSALVAGAPTAAPLVLIHGLGWDGERLWTHQIAPMVADGWRVVVPDLRGTGQSQDLSGPVTIADFAADLAGFLQELQATAPVLVGFSMGAMVATDLALRGDCQPRGVVLACGGLHSTEARAQGVEAMLARALADGPETFAAEQSRMIFGPSYMAAQAEAVADFARWRAKMHQPSLHHAFRAPFGFDYRPRLTDLPCLLHVIAAEQDAFLSTDDADAIARLAGQPAAHLITDSGHMAPVEQPDAFTATLRQILAALPAPERTN